MGKIQEEHMKKIVIIGAGSLNFSSRLTADILSFPALQDSHFALVDVDPVRLDYATQIVNKIFQEGGYSRAKVSSHVNRREALEGADFIIVSILVGGYEAIQAEIDIPMKYGIDQCIGDTLTPGGIMRCLRTLPELQAIAREVRELCPHAHVLNYTNPMGMLSWGFTDEAPDVSYVGLCHSVQGTSEEWANRCGVPLSEVNFQCFGINHQAWFVRFEHQGVDLLPRIRELALEPEHWWGDTSRMEYVKHLGFPVTESSGHISEYNPWFRKNDESVKRYCPGQYSDWNGSHGFIKTLYERPNWKQEMADMASWKQPISLERSSEYGSQIIHSLVTGENSIIHGNVKNRGFITNLPDDSIVEVPCLVNKNGIQPIHCGNLPTHLAAINRGQLSVQELAVRAVQTGDPEFVFQAMIMDPLTAMSCTLDEIRAMTQELMEAHAQWIPVMNGRLLAEKPLMYKTRPTGPVSSHVDPGQATK